MFKKNSGYRRHYNFFIPKIVSIITTRIATGTKLAEMREW